MLSTRESKIPSGWQWASLGEISEVVSKGTTPTTLGHAFVPRGVPFLRAEDVTGGPVDLTSVALYISSETHSFLARSQLKPGDLLITIAGTLGRVGYVPKVAPALNCNQAVAFVRLIPDLVDVEYARFACQCPEVMGALTDLRKVGTIGNLNLEQVRDLRIPLPPLPEQKRVAAILERADRLRRMRQYAQRMSEKSLQAVFVRMFGDMRTNPMGWDVETLENLQTRFDYGTSAKCTPDLHGLPVLRIPNILHGDIDLDDLKYAELPDKEARKLLLGKGDLIFVRTNGNPDYVGRCAVFNLDRRYLFASYLIRAKLHSSRLTPLFVQAHLRAPSGRKAMSPFIRTTAGQSNIGIEGLGQIPVPVPPLALQEQYARVVQRFDRLRAQQREAERQAEQLFQALLHRAFSGEL